VAVGVAVEEIRLAPVALAGLGERTAAPPRGLGNAVAVVAVVLQVTPASVWAAMAF
jgi:hypothetical protein